MTLQVYKETPYGDIMVDDKGELSLEYFTFFFSDFDPDVCIDGTIDAWLIDNDYIIVDRSISICNHEPDSLNYIYYNEETNDYDEVEVPLDATDLGLDRSYLLKYILKKA